MKKLKAGTKVRVVETNLRRINKTYMGTTGTVVQYTSRFAKFKVRMDINGRELHWYQKELKLVPIKLKQFSAWK